MKKPKVIILSGYGLNCEEETKFAFEKAGGIADIVHINDLIAKPALLSQYQILVFPGGFSYGDDTGSGNALANKIRNNLQEDLLQFIKGDKLVIGICNGMQIMTNLGLVPASDEKYGERQAAMMHNATARLECRWIHVKNESKKCIWTKDVELMHLPISHGEGNFYCSPEILQKMKDNDQIVFKYAREDGSPTMGEYPHNPNGALEDIAGICDETGKIFALMPHPERFNSFENEDGWELKKEKLIREGKEIPRKGAGLKIFENGVEYFS
mgnify:CR=1 FL=1